MINKIEDYNTINNTDFGYNCSSKLYLNNEAKPAVEKTKQCQRL